MSLKRAAAFLACPLVAVFMSACASEPGRDADRTDRTDRTDVLIPLNLDYSLPSLVDPDAPWGWWLQPLGWAGIESEVLHQSHELRLARSKSGPAAEAVYDLNSPFAGSRLSVQASVRAPEASNASVRIGLRSLSTDWQLTQGWSEGDRAADLVATLSVGQESQNVQILVEYSGQGDAFVSPLRLSVDGSPVENAVLPGQAAPPSEDVAWVRSHALALQGTDPQSTLADLDSLEPLVGNARFVLLGESTHGTSEFFTLKHRIVRWLAEQKGFTVFALEDHDASAKAIDRYVQTGQGDPEAVVKGLFGFWSRQEVLDLVRWMRQAVAAGRANVAFTGFDMQVPLGAMASLDAFAAEYDPSLADRIGEAVSSMREAWEEGWYPQRSAEEYARWSVGARRLLRYVKERSATYRERVGDEQTDQALYDARLILQSAEVSGADDFRVRDRFMAENLSWFLEHSSPGTRVAVWAHNTHVRLDEGAMGEHLERLHPGQVVSLGLFTHEGSYTAFDGSKMSSYSLFPGPVGSVEDLLDRAGHPALALDIRGEEARSEGPFGAPLLHRNIGLNPADLGFYRARMTDGFHGLVFVKRSSATRVLE